MRHKLKILMILNYGWEFGGGETSTLNLKSELERNGNIVKIFSSNNSPNKKHFSDYEFKEFNNNIARLVSQVFNFRSYSKLKRVLREFKPDLVHIRGIDYQVTSSILLCLRDLPTIMRINSYSNLCPMNKMTLPNLDICNENFNRKCINCIGLNRYLYWKLKYSINRILFRNVDLFEAVSNYIKTISEKERFKRVETIYNGIKLSKYPRILRGGNLLYVGRLSNEKGVKYLLKAMPEIIKKFPNINLNIVGDGPEKKNLIRLAKELDILKNITFTGQISNKDTKKYYKSANLVIIPSILPEPFGNTGLEILNEVKPTIGTNVGGIPEWIEDGKTGYLTPQKNSDAIAEKVIYLLKRPKLMQKMGLAGRRKAEREFDIKNQARKVEDIYRRLIKQYKDKR